MHKILTNHELPWCMMESFNLELNNYDFVLFHLYIKDEKYRKYFLELRKSHPQRLMILDNSAYEFFISKEEFNMDEYSRTISELNPDYYIIPDVLMDQGKTMDNFLMWMNKFYDKIKSHSKAVPMCVPQGKLYSEFEDCLNSMVRFFKEEDYRVCIPFHNSFFLIAGSEDNEDSRMVIDVLWGSTTDRTKYTVNDLSEDDKYAVGRCLIMDKLTSWENDNKKLTYHLLGSHNPVELKYLKRFDNILTYDTGYPVKLAISSGPIIGFETKKPELIIDDFFHFDLKFCDIHNILYNIKTLRANYVE